VIRSRTKDVVALGTLALVAACVCLAVGLAFGRPVTEAKLVIANRYLPLPAPLFVVVTLGTIALLGRKTRELALIACFAIMAATTPGSIAFAEMQGTIRRGYEIELDEMIHSGASVESLRAFYSAKFFPMENHGWWPLQYFAKERLPPFDRASPDYLARFDPAALAPKPFEVVESATPPLIRRLDGEEVYCISTGTTLRLACTAENHVLSGWIGAPHELVERGIYPRVNVRAVLRDAGGAERELGEIVLDPVHQKSDREMRAIDFRWEPGRPGAVLLRFDSIDRSQLDLARAWIKLRGVRVD